MIEWAWRIEDATSILCGSDNDDDEWDVSFARLLGRTFEDMSLVGRLPEISVSLSDALYVVSFNTLDGEPAWTIFDNAAGHWIRIKEAQVVEEGETDETPSKSEGAAL